MIKISKGLLKGSFILLIAFGIYNFFNFIFQFSMARLLTIEDFGILASLYSIIYALALFTEAIQIVITKYASKETDKGRMKNILRRSLRKSFLVASVFFLAYLPIAIFLSFLLKINYLLLALNGLMIFAAFLTPITRGIMQGKERFKSLGLNMVIESTVKLAFAVLLVFFGWKVYGAIAGTLIGVSAAFILSFLPLKNIIKVKEKKVQTKEIYNYSKPVFFVVMAILIFYSIDIIIARIFFPADIAGSYAIASILAKTIFLGTQPISKAMFPMSSKKNSKEKPENIFANSLLILLLAIIAALLVFYLFPELLIKIFSGRNIAESAGILFNLGLAISLISITNLILLYKISIGKVKGYAYLIIFIFIEIFLLSYFSKDLFQFSLAFVTASTIFLWGSIVLLNE